MASPATGVGGEQLTEIVTTTLRHRRPSMADNVANGNALLARLLQRGNIITVDGGRVIDQPLMYAETSTFQWYSGYDTLNVGASDVLSMAEYPWKQAAVNVTFNGLESQIQNAGSAQVRNLVASRIRVAEITMRNNLSIGIYSDGTGTGGKQITGLQSQVADAPTTGTVGGINRASFSFWQNNTSGDVADLTSAGAVERELQSLWLNCSRGPDQPDLIVLDDTLYSNFWTSLQAQQRINQPNEGVRGFRSLAFNTADVVFENGSGNPHDSGIPANHGYMLNTENIFLVAHSARNMATLDRKMAINQDATVVPIVFAGNLTLANASLQGVVFT